MSARSKAAFQFSAERLGSKLYFWTFTYKELHELKLARELWGKCLKEIKRNFPKLAGLRVFELHDRRGLHIHMLTNRFIWIETMKKMGKSYGFGRIEAKRADEGSIKYLAKYLNKEREECMKSARLWSAFGDFVWCKCKDIVFDSPFTRIYRALCMTYSGFSKAKWCERYQAVMNQYFRDDLPDYFITGKFTASTNKREHAYQTLFAI
jgi:hypothetical protein